MLLQEKLLSQKMQRRQISTYKMKKLAFINVDCKAKNKFKSLVDKIILIKDRNIKTLTEKYNLKKDDIILVHEGFYPVTKNLIKEIIKNAKYYGASMIGIKAKDTIKEVDDNLFVKKTLDRREFMDILYPRAIKYSLFEKIGGEVYNTNSLIKLEAKIIKK